MPSTKTDDVFDNIVATFAYRRDVMTIQATFAAIFM